ncbi:MAG: tetratricopeptide repeat protein [Verrucomicrobiota bacterium]
MSSVPASPPGNHRLPTWKLCLFWLALILFLPCLFLGVIEGILRLSGYGYATTFFVKAGDGETYTTNPKFAWQFYSRETATRPHPVFLPAQKQAGTLRVFVVGESAAAGTPDPAFGFARILEVMLRRQFPDRRIEVINAAMRGINSHIILPIARECVRLQPDLFIVYMGNNEAIGLHGPEPRGLHLTPCLTLLRLGQWMKAARLAQLIEAGIRLVMKPDTAKSTQQDMPYFREHRLAADDLRRRAVYDNFQANLEDICRTMQKAGAKAIVSTVAVNLKDFPPLASLHRPNLTELEKTGWEEVYAKGMAAEKGGDRAKAIQQYTEALRVDDHFAELHFRLGRCYAATGEASKARDHYRLARDWDALQFRIDSRLNEIIRQTSTAKEGGGVCLVDAEQAFAGSLSSEHNVPGEKLFNDQVHFNFEGDYLLAKTVLTAVTNALGLGPSSAQIPNRQECADLLAFTSWDELNVATAMTRMTSKPPFLDQLEHAERQERAETMVARRLKSFQREDLARAVQIYRQAIAQSTNDWQLYVNFGNLLSDLHDYPAAIAPYENAVKLRPELLQAKLALGDVLLKAGRFDQAARQFSEALRIDPDSVVAKLALAEAESKK